MQGMECFMGVVIVIVGEISINSCGRRGERMVGCRPKISKAGFSGKHKVVTEWTSTCGSFEELGKQC